MIAPKVSIITPTYNADKTLTACIKSIASQSYKSIEHIIVDGLSQDNTVSIIQDFVNVHDHIRYITEKDHGIYDAMNKGIRIATGDWVYFLGSDDIFYNDDVLLNIFGNDKLMTYDVLYGDVFSTRFGGVYDGVFDGKKIIIKNICHQAIFFQKSVFAKTGDFNINFRSHADWDHNLKWFLDRSVRRKYISLIVANYADGGFSSLHSDHAFANAKPMLALSYDKGILSEFWRARLARTSIKLSLRSGRLINVLRYLLLYVKLISRNAFGK